MVFGKFSSGISVLLTLSIIYSFGFGDGSAQAYLTNRTISAQENKAPLSIAVLPFRNALNDMETASLGDGIADSLTNALKNIERLAVADMDVVSEAAKKSLKSDTLLKDEDALQIGQQLAVQMLIAGSYQRLGDKIRIEARILSININRVLPGKAINAAGPYPDGYFDLLTQLAAQVTSALQVSISHQESEKVKDTLRSTQSPQSYQLYSQGMKRMRAGTPEALTQAIRLFSEALDKDPNYSLAYAAKSEAEAKLLELRQAAGQDTASLGKEALSDANKAVKAAPNIGRGYTALARAQTALGNYSEAVYSAQRAVDLWPSDANAYLTLAKAQGRGRLTRNSALDRALQLQPGLVFIFSDFPKVLIVNNSQFSLTVQFSPTYGEPYPRVSVNPGSSRIVGLLPGSYKVVIQSQIGEKVEQHDFVAGSDYSLTFDSTVESRTEVIATSAFVFKNTGAVQVSVQIIGPQRMSLIIGPGETRNVNVPPGKYSVFASAAGAKTSREVNLEAGQQELIEYHVERVRRY